ncbi:MAG: hypothetical protein IT378_03445 [Sandaracinaceae bacterium]|nr:hypothetical protein [Sandaracinaceae bacterium]
MEIDRHTADHAPPNATGFERSGNLGDQGHGRIVTRDRTRRRRQPGGRGEAAPSFHKAFLAGFGRAWEVADDLTRRIDSLRDVESVNRWLREQPWCDPDRLVISGAS